MELPPILNSMYVWAIALLLFSAGLAAKTLGIIPTNLIIAIAICAVLDISLKKFYLKREEIRFPYSAVISGIIIGSIAPFVAPPVVIVVASIIAICSKIFIRHKGNHIFNPAVIGLLVALGIFSLQDEWWGAIGYKAFGVVLPVTLLLILANYKAAKLKIAIPYLAAIALLFYFSGLVKIVPFSAVGLLAFANVLPFYFAFIMLSEPKTSPYDANQQVVFGIGAAILVFAMNFAHVKYAFLIALLISNLIYFGYRNRSYLS